MSTYEQKLIAHYSGARGRILAVGYAKQRKDQREAARLAPPPPDPEDHDAHVKAYDDYLQSDMPLIRRLVNRGAAPPADYLRYRIFQSGYSWNDIVNHRRGGPDMEADRMRIFYDVYTTYPGLSWRALIALFGGRDQKTIRHLVESAKKRFNGDSNG